MNERASGRRPAAGTSGVGAREFFRRLTEGHPVLSGLAALAAVAVVIGLFLALGALTGSRVAGVGGVDSAQDSTEGASMYLPDPSPSAGDDPSPPGTGNGQAAPEERASEEPSAPVEPVGPRIVLAASTRSAASGQRVDLTGTFTGRGSPVVQFQRFEAGRWVDFPVSTRVQGGRFATYVTLGRPGPNRLRVVGPGLKSNPVVVVVR
ncbi:MAG: hypothetical protein ACRCYQ_03850 [Nocardioides sp.]